jgi:hypothetical protein
MGDAYTSSFPDKPLMNRYPYEFLDYKFGIYWDSFGHKEESARHMPLPKSPRLVDRWMVAPMGGETAFDWGTALGKDPTDAVVNNAEQIIGLIRDLDWNYLGWLSDYDLQNRSAVENGARRIQEALGLSFRHRRSELSCIRQGWKEVLGFVPCAEYWFVAILLPLANRIQLARPGHKTGSLENPVSRCRYPQAAPPWKGLRGCEHFNLSSGLAECNLHRCTGDFRSRRVRPRSAVCDLKLL